MSNLTSIEDLKSLYNPILSSFVKLNKYLYFAISKNKCSQISETLNFKNLKKAAEISNDAARNLRLEAIIFDTDTRLRESLHVYKDEPFFISYINEVNSNSTDGTDLFRYCSDDNLSEMEETHFDKLVDLTYEAQYSALMDSIKLKNANVEDNLYIYPKKIEEFKEEFSSHFSNLYPSEIDKIFTILEKYGYINDYKKCVICMPLTSFSEELIAELAFNKEEKTFKQKLEETYSSMEFLIKDFKYYENIVSEKNKQIEELKSMLDNIDKQLNTSYLTRWY